MTGVNGRAAGNVGEVVVLLPAGFLNATRVPQDTGNPYEGHTSPV
jgi:hypothetical protein